MSRRNRTLRCRACGFTCKYGKAMEAHRARIHTPGRRVRVG